LSVAAHQSPRKPLDNLVQWGAQPRR